jgi:hypothetical protein
MTGEIEVQSLEEIVRDSSLYCRIFQKAIEENCEESSVKVDSVPAEVRTGVLQN